VTDAPTRLPQWWDPLLSRLEQVEAADFSRLPVPASGGRSSAVLILLGDGIGSGSGSGDGTPTARLDAEPDVLVLERAATLRNHAGQAAFPGGRADPDDVDAPATALREATEEVGLDPTTVQVVAELPTLWIPVSRYLVTPVLAWWHTPHEVGAMDPGEVARVERLPLRELVDPANRLRVRHPSGWIGPAFRVRGMLVWGFTAGVLATLLDLGGWAEPWSSNRIEEIPGVA
jgi:8-oxo-dGTP pyrophosphatase MutT (NUDIX family)